MEQTADRLSEKLHTLSTQQLAIVERFVESLQTADRERAITGLYVHSSQLAFKAVWSNPEDEVYDAL